MIIIVITLVREWQDLFVHFTYMICQVGPVIGDLDLFVHFTYMICQVGPVIGDLTLGIEEAAQLSSDSVTQTEGVWLGRFLLQHGTQRLTDLVTI